MQGPQVVLSLDLAHSIKDSPVQFSDFHLIIMRHFEAQVNNFMMHKSTKTSNHPSFFSDTKYAHQFPRTERFRTSNPECPVAFYSYSSQLSARQTSIGFGKKSDFTKDKSVSPPSTRYKHQSLFAKINGKTFGCPREQCPDRSYLIPQIHRHPSPFDYKKEENNTDKDKYTIRTKTIDPNQQTTNLYTPGPAAYQSIELENTTGKYHVSKFVDSKLGTIEGKVKRFPALKRTPGPTAYNPHQSVIDSRHQKIGIRGMDREARFTSTAWKTKRNPAPNNYLIPSEFPQIQQGEKPGKAT